MIIGLGFLVIIVSIGLFALGPPLGVIAPFMLAGAVLVVAPMYYLIYIENWVLLRRQKQT